MNEKEGQHAMCDGQHHFNPRPARGRRHRGGGGGHVSAEISIHAPREGGDCPNRARKGEIMISIHAPREGGDVGNN